MPRRILGQCNQVDFADIEHLVMVLENPEMLDLSTLKKKQEFAFRFVAIAQDKGISWELLREVIREVLFWGENGEKITHIEIRFIKDRSKVRKIREFRGLWGW